MNHAMEQLRDSLAASGGRTAWSLRRSAPCLAAPTQPSSARRYPEPQEAAEMAHHKRGRAKQRRAGCLLCKPHKRGQRKTAERVQARRAWRRREGLE